VPIFAVLGWWNVEVHPWKINHRPIDADVLLLRSFRRMPVFKATINSSMCSGKDLQIRLSGSDGPLLLDRMPRKVDRRGKETPKQDGRTEN
jgi:hypothetical protein